MGAALRAVMQGGTGPGLRALAEAITIHSCCPAGAGGVVPAFGVAGVGLAHLADLALRS